MKKSILLLLLLCSGMMLVAQSDWIEKQKAEYPASSFFTGFYSDNVLSDETKAKATERIKAAARADLSAKIRVLVSSQTEGSSTSVKTQGNEQFNSIFEKTVKTSVEETLLTGSEIETYTDTDGVIHAFAYVNKYELKGSYNAMLKMNMQQLEGVLTTAKQLENDGEKAKARTQYEEAVPWLAKVEQAQDVLVTLDKNASLQRDKTAQYRSEIIQALARLAQGVYVYVESSEKLFGETVDIVANKVKAALAIKGCSFVSDPTQADFRLRIRVTTRKSDSVDDIVFCYADATVELYDNHKKKVVYSDEIAQKGGSNSLDKAGRKAMGDVAEKIAEKLKPWIEN